MAHIEHINGEGIVSNAISISSVDLQPNNIYCLELIISQSWDFSNDDTVIISINKEQVLFKGKFSLLVNNNILAFKPLKIYSSGTLYINENEIENENYILSEVENILKDKEIINNINIEGYGDYKFVINNNFFNLDNSLQLVFANTDIYFFSIYKVSSNLNDYLLIDYWLKQ